MCPKKNSPDFAAQLQAEMGRKNMDIVVNAVGDREDYFASLINIVLHGAQPLPMRAAWAVSICLESHPEWIKPHLPALLEMLPHFGHTGIRRSILRSLAEAEIPEKWVGYLADHCFEWMMSSSEPVSVKVYAMQILYKIVCKHPELGNELAECIESIIPDGSAGIKSRGKKILSLLHKGQDKI